MGVDTNEFGPPVVGPVRRSVLNRGSLEVQRGLAAECTLSLCVAMEAAGGSVAHLDLCGMSLMDFITSVAAQNNIRFVYVKSDSGGVSG